MKKIILIFLFSIFIIIAGTGCSEKRLVLVPQNSYYPTFPIEDFNTSKKYKIEMYSETEDVNGTTINYLVAEEKPMLGFIKNTKDLRKNYNLLINKIKAFNAKIKEMNKSQNSKKPQEVKSIDDNFYK